MTRHKLSKSKRGPYYLLLGPYDQELVDAVKALPEDARAWIPGLKAWRISEAYHEQVQAMLDAKG